MPILSGCLLLGLAFIAAVIGGDVFMPIMVVAALASIVVAFPELRTLGLEKGRLAFARPPLGPAAASPALRNAATAFYFGALSGDLTAIGGALTGDLNFDVHTFTLLDIPKLAPVLYTIALAVHARLVSGVRASLADLGLFLGVYLGWFAAIKCEELQLAALSSDGDAWLVFALTGMASGAVGAAISGLAVAWRRPNFRKAGAIGLMTLAGGVCGALLSVALMRSAGSSDGLQVGFAFSPLFVGWHASTMAVIGRHSPARA